MKILVVSNLYPPDALGGYELACAQSAEGLIARGHDVRVVCASRLARTEADPPHVRRSLRLTDEWSDPDDGHVAARRLTEAASRGFDAFNVWTLCRELEDFGPDVVYLHNLVGLGGLGVVGCLVFLGVPWVWQLGDYVPRELCSTGDGLIPGLARSFAHIVRGRYVAVSRRVADESRADGLGLNGHVEILPNWVTGPRPPARRSFFRGGPLRVVAAGRVDRQKGIDLLIEAVARLKDEGTGEVRLDVFGHVVDPGLAPEARVRGVADRVTFRGPVPHAELLERYHEYDLLAFPTRAREPFGLVALEAASRGCVPVISADCGVAEWLVHGVHCLKAERTAGGFAAAFRGVIEGREDLAALARRAASAVWADFHLDSVLPRIERQLALAAAEGRPRLPRGTPHDAYRMARMAEMMTGLFVQESFSAV